MLRLKQQKSWPQSNGGPYVDGVIREVLQLMAEGRPWEVEAGEQEEAPEYKVAKVAAGSWVEHLPAERVGLLLKMLRRSCRLSQAELGRQVNQSEGWCRNREAGTVPTTPDDWRRVWDVASRCKRLDRKGACSFIYTCAMDGERKEREARDSNLPANAARAAAMVEELCGLLTPQELAHVLGLVASIAESRADKYRVRFPYGEITELERQLTSIPCPYPAGALRRLDEENPA